MYYSKVCDTWNSYNIIFTTCLEQVENDVRPEQYAHTNHEVAL